MTGSTSNRHARIATIVNGLLVFGVPGCVHDYGIGQHFRPSVAGRNGCPSTHHRTSCARVGPVRPGFRSVGSGDSVAHVGSRAPVPIRSVAWVARRWRSRGGWIRCCHLVPCSGHRHEAARGAALRHLLWQRGGDPWGHRGCGSAGERYDCVEALQISSCLTGRCSRRAAGQSGRVRIELAARG